jgi:outer membrane receptor for ferrienterochelin and colicins
MLNKILIFLLVITTSQVMLANTNKVNVTGIVKTADGKPAEFINVVLKNTSYGSVTDANGYFNFDAIEGEYTMMVFSIVCHKKEFPVVLCQHRKNDFPDITIIENAYDLDQIVVTGQFYPQSLNKSVYKIKSITAEQIANKSATNIQSLLNTEIGIRLSNDMALGETDFELMGMSGNNVKVLIDGIPVIDRLAKKQSLSQIDVNTIERIEIVEGPMSVIYGSDALAGVINIITKKAQHTSKDKWKVGIKIQEETVGREYNFAKGLGNHNQSLTTEYFFKNGLYVGGSFLHSEFGGWQGGLEGRAKRWQPKTQILPGGRIGYSREKLDMWYKLDYLNENILTQNNINTITNTTSDKEFIVNRYTHQFQTEWKVSHSFLLSGAFSYQDYTRRTRTSNIDLSTGKATLSLESGAQDETTFQTLFARMLGVWKISPTLNFQPGIEFQGTNGVGDRINGEQQIDNAAGFLSAEYIPTSWFSLRTGLRSNFNSVFDAPKAIPSLNIKFTLSEFIDGRLSYGRGYRSPSLQELYYAFHDSNHNINGNPNLQAEYSNSYMSSFVWRSIHNKRLRLTNTVSGFYNDFTNRISLIEKIDEPGCYWYSNIDTYKTTGITLENSLVWNTLKVNLGISYIGRYNKYYKDDNYNANMSMFRFSPEISSSIQYDIAKVGTLSAFYKFTGQRHEYMLSGTDEIKLLGLDSYHWADFTYSRTITKNLDVQVGVKNIFDITQVYSSASSSDHGTSSGGSQLGAGRSYFANLIFNL